ncbi:MAG: tol-pal system protein YbgF [Mariprofundaceae bacterium]|nr:tol-pal system protein YbgF [Mariprofundaceae bacterium]
MQSLTRAQIRQAETRSTVDELKQRMVELESQIKRQQAELEALTASTRHLRKALAARSKTRRPPSSTTKPVLITKLNRIESSIDKSMQGPTQPAAESEENRYTEAYLALKSGRYEEAAAAFLELTSKYPQGEYTDQAWYWLGESYYAQHKLKKAVRPLKKVIADFPKSSKHAAAMLKLGRIYQELKRPGDATAVFQRLTKEHPDSTAAEHARIELYKLEKRTRK